MGYILYFGHVHFSSDNRVSGARSLRVADGYRVGQPGPGHSHRPGKSPCSAHPFLVRALVPQSSHCSVSITMDYFCLFQDFLQRDSNSMCSHVWCLLLHIVFLKRFCLFIFRERGREGGRERNINVREIHRSVAYHVPPPGDLAHNPGTCPDWESNWRPFGSQASSPSTEPHQPGLHIPVLKSMLSYVQAICSFSSLSGIPLYACAMCMHPLSTHIWV